MADTKATSLLAALSPDLLLRIRGFWFQEQQGDEDQLIAPTQGAQMRWFKKDVDFDSACAHQFGDSLKAIQTAGATAADIVAAAQPTSPLDWLSLILLLDQISRNVYRGEAAATVFNVFDPLAWSLATQAIKSGVPQSPEIRYRLGYRSWFYMPLMHAEDIEAQRECVAGYEGMRDDIARLVAGGENDDPGAETSDDVAQCRAVLERESETAKRYVEGNLKYANMHLEIIEQFGRYPHRNVALGRSPTPAETEYLENGGQTFG